MASASLRLNNGRSNSTNGRTKSTISCWVKRGSLGVQQDIWSWGENNSSDAYLRFDTADNLEFQCDGGGGAYNTTQLYRDTNAWYHIVCTLDGSNATDTLRRRMWVNGVQVQGPYSEGTFSAAQIGNTAQQDFWVGGRARSQQSGATEYFDGLIAHFHYCDGYSYDVSSFGEADATTGIWKPKVSPSVNYGDNGFFLKFDNSANMGLDSSGNGVNLTTSGTVIQTKNTPSNVFATFNPLDWANRNIALTNANGTATNTDTANWQGKYAMSTLGMSAGKYYAEFKVGNIGSDQLYVAGIIAEPEAQNINSSIGSFGYGLYSPGKIFGLTNELQTSLGAIVADDIIGIAFDVTNGTLQFYKNGSTIGSQVTSIATAGKLWRFGVNGYDGSWVMHANFGNGYFGTTAVTSAQNPADGNGIFEYSVPSGYKALCTKSINAQEYS